MGVPGSGVQNPGGEGGGGAMLVGDEAPPFAGFIGTFFFSDANQTLGMAVSADGINWIQVSPLTAAGAAFPASGVLRNCWLLYFYTQAAFYLAYTTDAFATSDTSFSLATLAPGNNGLWVATHVADISPVLAGLSRVWACEWFVDADQSVHWIATLGTGTDAGPFALYEMHPTAADFSTWSAPVSLGTGIIANATDAALLNVDGVYHLFTADLSHGPIIHYTSATFPSAGGWTDVGDSSLWGWGAAYRYYEAMSIVQLDRSRWRMYLDDPSGLHEYYTDSNDLNTWTVPQLVPMPGSLATMRALQVNHQPDMHVVAAALRAGDPGNGSGRGYNSANQSIANATFAVITFNTVRWDDYALFTTHYSAGVITIPVAGTYDIKLSAAFAGSAGGTQRYVSLQAGPAGGPLPIASHSVPPIAGGNEINISSTWRFAAGDVLKAIAYQDSGGALNLIHDANDSPELTITRIGP